MSVTLLLPYATYANGATVTLDRATESSLVQQGRANYVVNAGPVFAPLTAVEQQIVRNQSASVLAQPRLLPVFNAALSATRIGAADTRVAYVGDSTVGGAYASGVIWAGNRPLSPPILLAPVLSTLGVTVSTDNTFGDGGSGNSASVWDTRLTFGNFAGLNNGTPGYIGGGCFRDDTNAVATISMQGALPSDLIDVYYLTSAGGASFEICGGDGIIIGAAVSTNAAASVPKVTRTTSATNTKSIIRRQAGVGAWPILGIVHRHSTVRRLHLLHCGAGGTSTTSWADASQPYSNLNGLTAIAAHLYIIQLGINDAIAGTTAATVTTNMQTIIDACRLAGGDVIGVMPTPVAAGSASLANQRVVAAALRAVYQQNGVYIADNMALFGSQVAAQAAGLFAPANDSVHPGAAGYQAMTANVQVAPGLIS